MPAITGSGPAAWWASSIRSRPPQQWSDSTTWLQAYVNSIPRGGAPCAALPASYSAARYTTTPARFR